MKKFVMFFATFILALALFGCGTQDENEGYDYDAIPDTMESADGNYQIAFVTDIGQLKDKSFNQGTWEGVKRYAYENNKSYKYYQPANGNTATDDDRYEAMAAAANGGADIIVCAGFMQANALAEAAAEFTDVKFVFIDGWAMGFENISAIVFKEEQSGYFAGYAAVMEGYTKLGFSGGGGGTNPACRRFGYGFLQGASDAAVEKEVQVTVKYSWNYGSTFSASAELQTMLNGWYSTGTEVVFSVGGSMCQSAFAAASANDGKVIGVDVDQSGDSATVITSATKGLREGTMVALGHFYDGTWATISDVAVSLGAAENAVGLPKETWSMTNFTVDQYQTLFDEVVAGTITIDDDTTDAETQTYQNITLEIIE
ncbi:MAG TPA: BMP family ABC transporter substrate-binding protein [Bacillota bacterium]|nr:BMP family ABC transporter substrate-binding protein [Bacillota bacterium]HPJ86094.1 BMP family ABC transporter substrate-binding protein [Bacillota bacterium]HPQ62385.1 BMP family ABC transporter substrate-binding protein [Bacillota bacterium]HRX91588.1 BMP family ABC transporter substrate-binding protein [Candidatus Izemoplasmatales bacterium]